jgi:hypothetical protein
MSLLGRVRLMLLVRMLGRLLLIRVKVRVLLAFGSEKWSV